MLAVRWYLRFGLSYRDLEELLAERGIDVDHVTLFRWVQRFTPLLVDAARPCRHAVGGRWFVDETYVKVAGRWRYDYRAVDHHGQVIDVVRVRLPRHHRRPQVLHRRDLRPWPARRGDDRPGPRPDGTGRSGRPVAHRSGHGHPSDRPHRSHRHGTLSTCSVSQARAVSRPP